MHKAVTLAADAADSASTCGAVLSVGPFGATLSPGQEYAGFYPPPYGPRGFSPSGVNTNYASPSDIEGYISSIADFHLQRLRIYASHASWDRVEWIAFETIPVVAEIHGIRRAMATLAAEGRGKKFWIASAFPKGKPGQMAADGAPVDVGTVVDAMVRSVKGEALPDGVGINCTNPQFLPALVEAYTAALPRALRPWLVVYPDGGSVYDVATRTWSDAGRVAPALWARGLVEAVKGAEGWEGAIVGGCCKSSFGEVGALRKQVGRA
jgi:homocysteine S-methyltransferase